MDRATFGRMLSGATAGDTFIRLKGRKRERWYIGVRLYTEAERAERRAKREAERRVIYRIMRHNLDTYVDISTQSDELLTL